jgi:ABC-type multidrug transport system fused ATPase/permease subunit
MQATANVDLETDEKVQLAIKREFKQSTVIMVAHR